MSNIPERETGIGMKFATPETLSRFFCPKR
jgi:hypothetical protein